MGHGAPDYTRITEIKGMSPTATLVTIAVDANGNILGVLKGDYAGTLTTLAVDSQGRMLAVLSDPEDVFGNPNYMGAAELAVRLGSIHSFERRGQVIFMDGFEDGLAKWQLSGTSPASTKQLSLEHCRSGRFSCKLIPGDIVGDSAYIQHYERLPVLSKIGLEASIAFYLDLGNWKTEMELYDGAYWSEYLVTYDYANDRLLYQDANRADQVLVTGVNLMDLYEVFHQVKLVVDLVNRKYVRLLVDDQSYSMAGLDVYKVASTATPRIYYFIHAKMGDISYPHVFVDDVILTQNEPA